MRLTVSVLNLSGETAPILEAAAAAAEQTDITFASANGTFEELLEVVGDWTVLPEILMIEIPEGADPLDTLERYAARFPEGEAETILYGVPNDIDIYRQLRQEGVREVFSGAPGREEIEEVLEEIQQQNLRRTGIDPRKAVYVFSACGGAGGTSLAMTFARKFAREGRRTLYVDLDLATGPASFMFNAERGAKETMGLMEALANPNRIDALFLERAIDIADKNLYYLSARKRASDPDPVSGSIPVLIARAQQNFDMVILDVPWRSTPEVEMMTVQGHCYIVAPPSPHGLLGFSVLAKEIESAPARNPLYGVINRKNEYKSNDIDRSAFREASTIETFPIPYDASAAGRMFFEQKTYVDMSGGIRKAVERIIKTLPGEAVDDAETTKKAKKKKGGLFGS